MPHPGFPPFPSAPRFLFFPPARPRLIRGLARRVFHHPKDSQEAHALTNNSRPPQLHITSIATQNTALFNFCLSKRIPLRIPATKKKEKENKNIGKIIHALTIFHIAGTCVYLFNKPVINVRVRVRLHKIRFAHPILDSMPSFLRPFRFLSILSAFVI